MFGLFLAALDSVILHQLGTAAKKYARKQIGMIYDDDRFDYEEIYDHEEFYTMLQAAVDYSDLSQDTLLMLCGTEVFELCQTSKNYPEITFWAFLDNLENISGYCNDVSSFLYEETEDGGILLHYYYQWKGLEVIAAGFVKAVAKSIYSISIEMKVLTLEERDGDENNYHVCFSVHGTEMMLDLSKFSVHDPYNHPLSAVNDNTIAKQHPMETSWPITSEVFNELFPFNIVFDSNLIICAIGNAFTRLCPTMVNCCLTDLFKLHVPAVSLTYDNIKLFQANVFYLICLKCRNLKFKGEMFVNLMSAQVVYVCSPVVDTLENMNKCNIFVSDLFYIFDCQEAVFLNMHLTTATRVRKSLEHAQSTLGASQLEIESKKQQSLDLLHSILPSFAIDTYLKGKEFKPTKYDNVTVLFSDIKGFTSICEVYEPLDAVHMLDTLFSGFDRLSEEHGVFKLESYNDVYIVADTDYGNFNCPDAVFKMACDMRKVASDTPIVNTIDGTKIPSFSDKAVLCRIRIGIHTGPVVVAVLNKNMPHFSMFGHTVNKASRMCTHGAYSKIHVSVETHDILIQSTPDLCKYQFECRGKIPIKGLGNLTTYFVEPLQESEATFCPKLKEI